MERIALKKNQSKPIVETGKQKVEDTTKKRKRVVDDDEEEAFLDFQSDMTSDVPKKRGK